jgi:hypothetical protein
MPYGFRPPRKISAFNTIRNRWQSHQLFQILKILRMPNYMPIIWSKWFLTNFHVAKLALLNVDKKNWVPKTSTQP